MISAISHFRYVLLDLDDTLAPEWDFVVGGYRTVAVHLAARVGVVVDEVFNRLVYEHHKYGRRGVIDRVAAAFEADPALVPELVAYYRDHLPVMDFYPGARQALECLAAAGCRLAVVTDGDASMQRRKVTALGLDRFVEAVVYCWEMEAPKPAFPAFEAAMYALCAKPEETLVVGDDPYLDIEPAAALGIAACRVRTGKYNLVQHRAGTVIADLSSFVDLPRWLSGVTSRAGRP